MFDRGVSSRPHDQNPTDGAPLGRDSYLASIATNISLLAERRMGPQTQPPMPARIVPATVATLCSSSPALEPP